MTFLAEMRRGLRAMMVVAAVFAPAAAQAQAVPSANAQKTAAEIVKVVGAQEIFAPLVAGVVEQARLFFVQQNPMMANDATEVAAQVRKEFEPRLGELNAKVVDFYASRFSEAELKEILAFYTSAAGKKLLVEQPKIADESVKFAQDWSASLSDEVIGKMREGLKKKGHRL